MENFRKELEVLINKHSRENGSNTPDFILADYLQNCLMAFDSAVFAREQWYGRNENEVDMEFDELQREMKLEKAAIDINYNNICARATLYPGKSIDEIPRVTADDLRKQGWYSTEKPITTDDQRPTKTFSVYLGKGYHGMIGAPIRSWGVLIGNVMDYDMHSGEAQLQIFTRFEYESLAGETVENPNLWGLTFGFEPQKP